GFLFGVAFFLPLLTWLLDFLGPDFGPWPWLGLSCALAAYYGLGGTLFRVVSRLPLAPVWAALAFIALETPRTWFPFGGFPWGRVAFSQPEGAFLPLASIGGAPLVGFAVVLTGFSLATFITSAVKATLRASDARKVALTARGTVTAFGVPAVIGALVRLPDGSAQNSALVWDPRTGPGQRYAKQQLVPFGEYVPARDVARLVTPFVDTTGDMVPGTGANAALSVAGTKVGVFICYETAFDYPAREATADGGELLVVPTNNAWYGPGEMSYQQLAMSRLRAVEHGRAVVVSATSGVSALVAPDGTITSSTGLFTADALVGRVPLRTQTTRSDRLWAVTEYGLLALAIAGVAGGLVLRFRTRRARAGQTGEAAG